MGRETAGWFLIADLGLDWRMAAEWFESVLYLGNRRWFDPIWKGNFIMTYEWLVIIWLVCG